MPWLDKNCFIFVFHLSCLSEIPSTGNTRSLFRDLHPHLMEMWRRPAYQLHAIASTGPQYMYQKTLYMYCIQNLHYLFWSTICDFLEKIVLKVKIDCNNLKGHSCHLWGLKHYMKSKNSLNTKIPRLWFHKMYFL